MANCIHGLDARFCARCSSPADATQRRRSLIQQRAALRNPASDAEREALEAIFAYEQALSQIRGKKLRASRTWQMIERHGILPAVERIVQRDIETAGYRALVEMGLEEMAFEAVVLRHPNVFTPEARRASAARLAALKSP
jgi:hypothetical protein